MRVEQRHELDGVSLGHGLELVFERGLLVLLRDAHLAVGKDLGMQVARGGDEIHGIGQLGEFDEILELVFERGLLVLLRDAHLAVGKDLGMQVARGGDEIHGIGQLGEFDEIAKVDHEAQIVVIAQAVDVGGRAKAECT